MDEVAAGGRPPTRARVHSCVCVTQASWCHEVDVGLSNPPLPSHGEIAEIWGVSAKTVDNTLQRLRAKLRKQNISFIQSSETLVEYVVTQGLVTMEDLEWACLDSPTGPRPSATRSP